jgi:hypothetical protein
MGQGEIKDCPELRIVLVVKIQHLSFYAVQQFPGTKGNHCACGAMVKEVWLQDLHHQKNFISCVLT